MAQGLLSRIDDGFWAATPYDAIRRKDVSGNWTLVGRPILAASRLFSRFWTRRKARPQAPGIGCPERKSPAMSIPRRPVRLTIRKRISNDIPAVGPPRRKRMAQPDRSRAPGDHGGAYAGNRTAHRRR